MEMTNIVKMARWGTINSGGTAIGKPKKAGKIIVKTGIVSSRLNE